MADRYAILHTDANEGYYEGFAIPSGVDLKETSLEKSREWISHIHKQIDADNKSGEDYNAMITDTHASVCVLSPEYVEEYKDELQDLLNAEPDNFVSFDGTFPGDEDEARASGNVFNFGPRDIDFDKVQTREEIAKDFAFEFRNYGELSVEAVKVAEPDNYNMLIKVSHSNNLIGSVEFNFEHYNNYDETFLDTKNEITKNLDLMNSCLSKYYELKDELKEKGSDISISLNIGEPVKFSIEDKDGKIINKTVKSENSLINFSKKITKENTEEETQTSGMKM